MNNEQVRASNKSNPAVPILLSIILIAAVGIIWMLNKGILILNLKQSSQESIQSPIEESQHTNDNQDQAYLLAQIRAQDFGRHRTVAAGSHFTAGIKTDGTCVVTGEYCPDVQSWTDLVSLSAFEFSVAGLRSDGTVLCSDSSLDVHGWTDVIQIDYFSEVFEADRHLVGLLSDGTVVAAGTNNYGECDVDAWNGIVDVAAGSTHTVALREDGTVVACGNNAYGQCEVSEWRRIIDVDASRYATYGLTVDGEILVAGYFENEYGSYVPEVPQWDNVIAIIASNETGSANDFVVGICSDGTLVSNHWGYLKDGDIESFSDVRSVAVSSWGYIICCNGRGEVRDVGWDVDGARRIQDWPEIMTR